MQKTAQQALAYGVGWSRLRAVAVIILCLALALVLVPRHAGAERAKSPADAVVFIRLVGSVHADIDEVGIKRTVDLDHVELGTGSGFVISPFGYVLTNEHVVSNADQLVVSDGIRQAKLTLKVSRIDVCFRPEAAAAHALSSPCHAASVAGSDPTVDLAVLFISGSNLPYVALGDSDAVTAGLSVNALGYPFGESVEVGKVAKARDLVPEVSTTPGAVSAIRTDDAGDRRYLQISNSVNPGSSGGPVVTSDGFVVGVVRMGLRRAAGIAYAIPVNDVKDFLQSRGLDHLIPVRRVRAGGFQNIEAKGVGLRLIEGIADASPFRSRVESDPRAMDIALRIDRVLSPWNPKQIEETLVGTQTFEPLSMARRAEGRAPRPADPALLLGGAGGAVPDSNQDVRMEYAVLDLGSEKLVARYVGPAEWMAFNEHALHESLASLQARRLLTQELAAVEKLDWLDARDGRLPVPLGWVVEPGRPLPCPGLPQPVAMTATFAEHDFSVVLRAAVWAAGDVVPESGASACSPRRGSFGAATYSSRAAWLGVSYFIEGAFARIGPRQIAQLEVLAPEAKSALARTLLAAWLKKATE